MSPTSSRTYSTQYIHAHHLLLCKTNRSAALLLSAATPALRSSRLSANLLLAFSTLALTFSPATLFLVRLVPSPSIVSNTAELRLGRSVYPANRSRGLGEAWPTYWPFEFVIRTLDFLALPRCRSGRVLGRRDRTVSKIRKIDQGATPLGGGRRNSLCCCFASHPKL